MKVATLTSGSHQETSRIIWALAWPVVALNSVLTVNTILDRWFIGNLTLADLTAHGAAINVLFLIFMLGVSVATGATAIISRAFGANEVSEYRMAARQAFRLALYTGFTLALATVLFANAAAHILLPANDLPAMHKMTMFLLAYAIGVPAITMNQTLAGSLRAIGDTKSPMFISGLQVIVHSILDCFLIFPRLGPFHGLGLGLPGAAIGLASSCIMATGLYLYFLRTTPLGSVFSVQPPSREWAARIMRISIPAAMMSSLRVFSLTAFTILLTAVPRGADAIAGMSTAFAVESIMIMPAFGLAAAAAALVGQSLGMKDAPRAERIGWTAGLHGSIVTLCLVTPIYIGAPWIVNSMVGGKHEVLVPAVALLHALCLTEALFSFGMVIFGALQGAGDTKSPFWISLIALWLMRVPLALVLALHRGETVLALSIPFGLGLGPAGAWFAMSLTQAVQGIFAAIAFKSGAWKTARV